MSSPRHILVAPKPRSATSVPDSTLIAHILCLLVQCLRCAPPGVSRDATSVERKPSIETLRPRWASQGAFDVRLPGVAAADGESCQPTGQHASTVELKSLHIVFLLSRARRWGKEGTGESIGGGPVPRHGSVNKHGRGVCPLAASIQSGGRVPERRASSQGSRNGRAFASSAETANHRRASSSPLSVFRSALGSRTAGAF